MSFNKGKTKLFLIQFVFYCFQSVFIFQTESYFLASWHPNKWWIFKIFAITAS